MSSGFSIGFLGIGVLLLLVPGVILLKRGFWPRRRGEEPRCRACGYLLIGIESERCPECGAFLSPLAIVHGRRHRRHILGWAGVVMLLLFAGLLFPYLTGAFGDINWYHFKPTFWVMRDLQSSSPGVADVAMCGTGAARWPAVFRRNISSRSCRWVLSSTQRPARRR